MAVLDSYLFFNGNCAEAMRFYERTLGGKLDMMKYSDGPPEYPAGSAERIMHARLQLDGRNLMASDAPAGMAMPPMASFSLSLSFPAADEARRVYDALAAGGQATKPLEKTFFADAFGMLNDRFGTPWMVLGGVRG
jgi:PhnB protein